MTARAAGRGVALEARLEVAGEGFVAPPSLIYVSALPAAGDVVAGHYGILPGSLDTEIAPNVDAYRAPAEEANRETGEHLAGRAGATVS